MQNENQDFGTAGIQVESGQAAEAEKKHSENFHKFKKPFVFEGKTFDGIELDFSPLTGADMIESAKQFNAKGNFAVLPAYDVGFCAILAAKAAGKPAQFIESLPLDEFSQVTGKVTRFLTQAG